jgi:putative membrane protein
MNDVLFASDAWPHHWWFLFIPLLWLLVFFCVVRFVLLRRGGACWSRGERPGRERARGILDERYARGEIDDEEYRTRLSGLRADAQA